MSSCPRCTPVCHQRLNANHQLSRPHFRARQRLRPSRGAVKSDAPESTVTSIFSHISLVLIRCPPLFSMDFRARAPPSRSNSSQAPAELLHMFPRCVVLRLNLWVFFGIWSPNFDRFGRRVIVRKFSRKTLAFSYCCGGNLYVVVG